MDILNAWPSFKWKTDWKPDEEIEYSNFSKADRKSVNFTELVPIDEFSVQQGTREGNERKKNQR